MSCCNEAQSTMPAAQNDVANILTKLAAFLTMIASFFEKKTQATAQALSACEQALIDELKAEALGLVSRLPAAVQRYINCRLGISPAPMQPQFLPGLGSIASLGDFAKYLPQILAFLKAVGPYLPQIMEFIKAVTGSGTQAPAAPAPATPGAPLSPAADYSPTAVQRC